MTILLIWQTIPENLQVFLLDVTEFEGQRILKLSGKYENQAGNSKEIEDEFNWLSKLLVGEEPVIDDSDPERLGPFELNQNVKVVVSGVSEVL